MPIKREIAACSFEIECVYMWVVCICECCICLCVYVCGVCGVWGMRKQNCVFEWKRLFSRRYTYVAFALTRTRTRQKIRVTEMHSLVIRYTFIEILHTARASCPMTTARRSQSVLSTQLFLAGYRQHNIPRKPNGRDNILHWAFYLPYRVISSTGAWYFCA